MTTIVSAPRDVVFEYMSDIERLPEWAGILATCTISGLFAGRFFASKIRSTAAASSALAPRP